MPLAISKAVHPRVCGERQFAAITEQQNAGSSPRVRGTVRYATEMDRGRRFIPACAGNGDAVKATWHTRPVHPRVCGERIRTARMRVLISGSSPRVRGTVVGTRCAAAIDRFIPACAGNGTPAAATAARAAVHPRVCGERIPGHSVVVASSGSSPRVRGTGQQSGAPAGRQRFIPACAGNGSTSFTTTAYSSVHPRVCGERKASSRDRVGSAGSSPRVRGTGGGPGRARLARRFIPACAGNGRSLPDRR